MERERNELAVNVYSRAASAAYHFSNVILWIWLLFELFVNDNLLEIPMIILSLSLVIYIGGIYYQTKKINQNDK